MNIKKLLLPLALLAVSSSVQSSILFSEDFENGLSFAGGGNWSSNYSGIIVSDPIETDSALTFGRLYGGGDLRSDYFNSTTGLFNISFDYLGTCQTNNCGGFFWNSRTGWDGTTSPYRDTLIDDGSWHTLSFDVTATLLQIRLEDWNGSGGVAGDAFFDNIVITDGVAAVPEPSMIALLGLGLVGFGFSARRKRK